MPIRAGQDLADPAIRYSGGELPLRAARGVAVGLRRGQRLAVDVGRRPRSRGRFAAAPRSAAATVFVDGRRPARCRCGPAASIPEASSFDRARAFVADNPIPIALAVFVILIGGVLLYRRLSGRNDQGERIRVKAK